MKYIYLLVLVIGFKSVAACNCHDDFSLEEAVAQHKYVFSTEVLGPKVEKTDDAGRTKFTLVNLENIKGTPTSQNFNEYLIKTSCDATLKQGDKWLIFLNSDESKVRLSICDDSKPMKYIEWKEENWRNIIKNAKKKSVVYAKDAKTIRD